MDDFIKILWTKTIKITTKLHWGSHMQLSAIEASDITIYTVETSDIRRGEAESDIILARL